MKLQKFIDDFPRSDFLVYARAVVVPKPKGQVFEGGVAPIRLATGLNLPYIAFIGDTKGGGRAEIAVGYYGEAVILYATTLGLQTCWSGEFHKELLDPDLIKLRETEQVFAISPLGHAVHRGNNTFGESLVRLFLGGRKSPSNLCKPPVGFPWATIVPSMPYESKSMPEWVKEGILMTTCSPSWKNREPIRYRFFDAMPNEEEKKPQEKPKPKEEPKTEEKPKPTTMVEKPKAVEEKKEVAPPPAPTASSSSSSSSSAAPTATATTPASTTPAATTTPTPAPPPPPPKKASQPTGFCILDVAQFMPDQQSLQAALGNYPNYALCITLDDTVFGMNGYCTKFVDAGCAMLHFQIGAQAQKITGCWVIAPHIIIPLEVPKPSPKPVPASASTAPTTTTAHAATVTATATATVTPTSATTAPAPTAPATTTALTTPPTLPATVQLSTATDPLPPPAQPQVTQVKPAQTMPTPSPPVIVAKQPEAIAAPPKFENIPPPMTEPPEQPAEPQKPKVEEMPAPPPLPSEQEPADTPANTN